MCARACCCECESGAQSGLQQRSTLTAPPSLPLCSPTGGFGGNKGTQYRTFEVSVKPGQLPIVVEVRAAVLKRVPCRLCLVDAC